MFLAIDRHRNDDRKPYVFKSTDHGSSWTSIAGDLPDVGHVHVIREDPVNRDLLYVGTEFGLFVSLDGGKRWHKQMLLPTVPVHDLVVHPRDRELVIGTHGRAIWIMDVLPLQELANPEADARLLPIRPALAHRQELVKQNLGIKSFAGENPPYGAVLYIHLCSGKPKPAAPSVKVVNAEGETVGGSRVKWLKVRACNGSPGT